MSIAQGVVIAALQKDVLDISRALTDSQALIKALEQRIAALENKPKPGRPPKNG